jgi:hypothetical protein
LRLDLARARLQLRLWRQGCAGIDRPLGLAEGLAHQFTDTAQRADELRRLDGEEDSLGIGAVGEFAERLGVFLRDEIVDRHAA